MKKNRLKYKELNRIAIDSNLLLAALEYFLISIEIFKSFDKISPIINGTVTQKNNVLRWTN